MKGRGDVGVDQSACWFVDWSTYHGDWIKVMEV